MTNALLGQGLFGDLFRDPETAQAFAPEAFGANMIAFERAWTRALAATGAVKPEDAERALAALSAFDLRRFGHSSDHDGLPVPGLVAALRAGLSPEAAGALHSGATSQDVIDTAMVLTSLTLLDRAQTRLNRILGLLDTLAAKHSGAPIMARTRMQAAMPATVGLRVASWRRLVQARLEGMPRLRAELARVQIGGAIGLRDPSDERLAQHVANELGLTLTPVWHTDRAVIVELGQGLTLLTGALGKIGQDIALMAQQGLNEVVLHSGGASSAMPHKQNPVHAEVLVALARYVAGLQGTLAQAMVHEQERSGAAWALEWLCLPAMFEAAGAALRHTENLLSSIRRLGSPN
ncbi:MAG: hypothetical protein RLZ26_1849 [Pseudomonadota bacterium]|jgi:3-carboxy-cis,cis-muconate cycloisomerase